MESAQPQPALRRKSVFLEVGLVDEGTKQRDRSPAPRSTPTLIPDPTPQRLRPARQVRFRSKNDIFGEKEDLATDDSEWESEPDTEESGWDSLATMNARSRPSMFENPRLLRIGLFALALVLILPALQLNPLASMGVRAGVIPAERIEAVAKREDTNTEVCKRWAHQCMFSSHGG